MSYVKLDTAILSSSLWVDRDDRDVFLTALLMAQPQELTAPTPQLAIREIRETGWVVPPGWYGFVEAASVGIIRLAGLEREAGLAAIERLGSPDLESRSKEFDGRRLVRVDGGFVLLNYCRFRERDHTAAQRMRRYRDRHREAPRDAVTLRHDTDAHAHADADAQQIGSAVLVHPDPSAPPKTKRRKSSTPAEIRPDAAPVIARIEALRSELGLRTLQPAERTDRCIRKLLDDGVAVDLLLEVVELRGDDVRVDASQAQWLNPISPFTGPGVGGRPGGWVSSLRSLDRRRAPAGRRGPALENVDEILERRRREDAARGLA
jgi:hypothetical protein